VRVNNSVEPAVVVTGSPRVECCLEDAPGSLILPLLPALLLCFGGTRLFKQGCEHSAPFACTVLTRDIEDAFVSSATTGGVHFYSRIPFSVDLFYSVSAKLFRPAWTFDPKSREKKLRWAEKELVVVCFYTRGTPWHLRWLQLMPIWPRS
jgi:hypothetical protein